MTHSKAPGPPVPPDEELRLERLRATRLLDSAPDPTFDDIVRVASAVCGAPFAAVSLLDARRQWFKARVGLAPQESPRETSVCAWAIQGDGPLVVRDLSDDGRFLASPWVTEDPNLRFYAGIPLRVADGTAVGTLCVMDRVPRELTAAQLAALDALARQVSAEMRLRADLAATRTAGSVAVGDVVGGWRIDGVLGRGGGGVVFTGVDGEGRRVAIKVLSNLGSDAVDRFVREARVLARLGSPHVTRILDVGELPDGAPWLAMEHLHGRDLAAVLTAGGPVAPSDVVSWTRQACAGLAEAHAVGIVHRDLKPSNLFLADTVDGARIKVLDFGVAKHREDRDSRTLTEHDSVIGTPYYTAPEQLLSSSDVDGRADVWSLGVVMYELLTGRVPFDGAGALQVCAAVLARPVVPPRVHRPETPEALEEVVLACLEKEPEDRIPDVEELSRRLAALP